MKILQLMTKICLTYEQFFDLFKLIGYNLATIAIPIGIELSLIVGLSFFIFLINLFCYETFLLKFRFLAFYF
jgi:hypothetical protein